MPHDSEMTRNGIVTGKSVLLSIAVTVVIGVALGLILGWQYSVIGIGAGLGPLIGAHFGNKKAAEVDAYREEWLGRRKQARKDEQQSGDVA